MTQDIGKEISLIIKEYTAKVAETVRSEAERIAKAGAEELKRTSPKRTSKYAKGWAVKKTENEVFVYNKNKPSLTHLLEHGHALKDGGRVSGKPHIRPVEEKMKKDFEQIIEEIARTGGKL